jgi:hypothetical protein
MSRSAARSSTSAARMVVASDGDASGLAIPPDHVGPVALPGTGRIVWWTGRVAIGLRHDASRGAQQAVSSSALWIQSLLLGGPRGRTQAG